MTDFVLVDLAGVNVRIRTDLIAPKTTTAQNLTIMQILGIPIGVDAKDKALKNALRTGLKYTKQDILSFAAANGYSLDVREIGASDTYTRLVSATAPVPTAFTATPHVSLHQIQLAWTAPVVTLAPGQTLKYTVDRATNVGFTTGVTNIVNASATAGFLDTGLAGATHYWYRVKAVISNVTDSAYANANATTAA